MTAEIWDSHWYRIRNSLLADGYGDAAEMADLETVKEFGPRPPEVVERKRT